MGNGICFRANNIKVHNLDAGPTASIPQTEHEKGVSFRPFSAVGDNSVHKRKRERRKKVKNRKVSNCPSFCAADIDHAFYATVNSAPLFLQDHKQSNGSSRAANYVPSYLDEHSVCSNTRFQNSETSPKQCLFNLSPNVSVPPLTLRCHRQHLLLDNQTLNPCRRFGVDPADAKYITSCQSFLPSEAAKQYVTLGNTTPSDSVPDVECKKISFVPDEQCQTMQLEYTTVENKTNCASISEGLTNAHLKVNAKTVNSRNDAGTQEDPHCTLHSEKEVDNEVEQNWCDGVQVTRLDLVETSESVHNLCEDEDGNSVYEESSIVDTHETDIDTMSPSIYEQLLTFTGKASVAGARRKIQLSEEVPTISDTIIPSPPLIPSAYDRPVGRDGQTRKSKKSLTITENKVKNAPISKRSMNIRSENITTLMSAPYDYEEDLEVPTVDLLTDTLFSKDFSELAKSNTDLIDPSAIMKQSRKSENPGGLREEIFLKLPNVYNMLSCPGTNLADRVGLPGSVISLKLAPTHGKFGSICVHLKHPLQSFESNDELLSHCVEYLTELEEDLKAQAQVNRKGPVVESMDRLTTLIMLSNLSKYFQPTYTNQILTKSLIRKLNFKRTRFGGNVRYCIRANAYCPRSLTPKACDPDAYSQFVSLFEPILRSINRTKTLLHPLHPRYGALKRPQRIQGPSVISYRLRFVRNLADFPFYPLMTKAHYLSVERKCRSALLSWPDEPSGVYYTVEDIKSGKCRLAKKYLPNSNTSAVKVNGSERHWPHGRGVFIAHGNSIASQLVVQVNVEDHLRVICIDMTGERLSEIYGRVVKLMYWLDKSLVFATKSEYGFLSPNLFNVGTGMRISALLPLPNLLLDKEAMYNACIDAGVRIRPGDGIGAVIHDSVCDVSPITVLGITEKKSATQFSGQLRMILAKEVMQGAEVISNNSNLERDDDVIFRATILGQFTP